MAMISGSPKNIFPAAVGFGTLVLAPIAAVVLIGAAKPVARMVIKGGVLAGAFVRTSGGRSCNDLQRPGGRGQGRTRCKQREKKRVILPIPQLGTNPSRN